MDRVRLGRVLGRGARMAARTVVEAVDAATTSSPNKPASEPPQARRRTEQVQTRAGATLGQAVRTAGRVQSSARAAQAGLLQPVKRASRAVTLEIAGSFFALFALSFGAAAWRFRGLAEGGSRQRLWLYLGFAALFAYFACTSFLRARRLSRA